MADGSMDVGSLEGDELTRWYLRSPAEIEQERQAAAAKRYQDFFYGPSGTDPDPGFARELPAADHDVDPGFARSLWSTSQDIDPGFTWVQVGPNRFRSVRPTNDDQPAGPLSLARMSYSDAASVGDVSGAVGYQDARAQDAPVSQPDLTPRPLVQLDGELRQPPAATFGPQSSAANRGEPQTSVAGGLAIPMVAPMRASAVNSVRSQAPAAGSNSAQTIAYGALRAPAPSDQEMAELRRQQAAFADTTRKIDLQDSWFAVPALAPPLVALGLGAAGEWVTGEVAPAAGRAVANFVERDPYLRVGDNWATRAGRRAHAALKERLAQKEGWEYEPKLARPGQRPLKPDLGTPKRDPQLPDKRMYGELKPDSPSGRAAGARALKKYQALTDDYIRLFLYNLKDFI